MTVPLELCPESLKANQPIRPTMELQVYTKPFELDRLRLLTPSAEAMEQLRAAVDGAAKVFEGHAAYAEEFTERSWKRINHLSSVVQPIIN